MERQRLIDMINLPMQHIMRYALHLKGARVQPWALYVFVSHAGLPLFWEQKANDAPATILTEIIKNTPAQHPDSVELVDVHRQFAQILE
jgi:hypothetical protein